ncbi:MAG TPA: hypothetical protein VMF55_12445 [Solirubrobacterales bacterium]|nr:hypothetical protein [Solirubrobacterales bacterium]
MSPAEFISAIAWPLTVLVIALVFRRPLSDALRSASGALSAGPFRLEWEKRAEAVEADLGRAPSISKGEIGGASGRLDEIADTSPTGAIVEAFGQIELSLRSVLEADGADGLDRPWSVQRLGTVANQRGLITPETLDAIEGLSVMRNLAAHGGQKDLSPQRAREFVALSQGVLYAISMNAKSSKRSKDEPRADK